VIGHEIRGARDFFGVEQVVVVGGASLSERYAAALGALGIMAEIGPADAAARGLMMIAGQISGL